MLMSLVSRVKTTIPVRWKHKCRLQGEFVCHRLHLMALALHATSLDIKHSIQVSTAVCICVSIVKEMCL